MVFVEPIQPRFRVIPHIESGGEMAILYPTKKQLAEHKEFGCYYYECELEKVSIDWSTRKIRGSLDMSYILRGGVLEKKGRYVRHFTFEEAALVLKSIE